MRIFITGASGHIGSAVVADLLEAGHEVIGLARSDSSAATITASGAEVQRGDLTDTGVLSAAAAASDGVIHLAFGDIGADMAGAIGADLAAIEAIGTALAGTGKPFVSTNATLPLSFLG
ncbi:MAG: NAD-dependent epimerase/dehydratase family protein, partial [Actinoplanes sp.]